MSNVRKLFSQSSYYLTSNVMVVLAGAISLPVWTRLLSQHDYGLYSLFNITIAFMVTFSKFGLQHSSLRFYSDFKSKKKLLSLSSYFTTMFIGGLCISGISIIIIILFVVFFFRSQLDQRDLLLLPLIGSIVLIQSTNNLLTIFLRAEQHVKLYSLIHILRRYGRLGFAVLLVFLLGTNLYSIYMGWIISGGVILLVLVSRLLYHRHLSLSQFSLPFFKEAIMYGFPMIWFELSSDLLCIGDRYVIQYYMGEAAVGIYSVGYNAADLTQSLLTFPLRLAVVPIYLSMWNTKGEEKTQQFLGQALKYYFMFGIPLALGVSWFSKDIITLLATKNFEESHTLIPYIIFPLIIYGSFGIYGAGLYIQKKTTLLMYSTLIASGINVILNFVLVPRFGILGAAYATFISYIVLSILIFVQSYSFLKVSFDLPNIVKYSLLSITTLYISSALIENAYFLIQIALVVLLYLAGVLLIDKQLRLKTSSLLMGRLGI